jgi:hypothetical protein
VTLEKAEAILVESIWKARKRLREVAPAAFSDHVFMYLGATYHEWRDFLKLERAILAESVSSSEPANIIYSKSTDSRIQSKELRERLQQRELAYGAVDDLFFDPSRRHLVELSICSQRLSKVLERRGSAEYQFRSNLYDSAIEIENSMVRSRRRQLRADEFNSDLRAAFNQTGSIRFAGSARLSLSFFPHADQTAQGFNVRVQACIEVGSVRKEIPFHRLLPSHFVPYSTCNDVVRAEVSFNAWKVAISEVSKHWLSMVAVPLVH